MDLQVGCVLGSRANAWHSEVFRELPEGVRATVVGTTNGRYPTGDLVLPFEALPWENEAGSLWLRKLHGLRYRLLHPVLGTELRLARAGAQRLARFDVLDTWELYTDWTGLALDAARARRIPLVVTVWDNLTRHFPERDPREATRRRALLEADRFLVVSAGAEARLLLEGVDPGRIVRLRPSVDPGRFTAGDPRPVRDQLGIGPGDRLVLAVARLEAEKGLDTLLDAVALGRLRRDAPSYRVAIVGSGRQEQALRARAERLGLGPRVTFAGDLPFAEMPAWYRAADAFVLPSVPTASWQEQWGQSLLEAMASGTPAVGTLTGGIPETLGDAGLLVPPADALGLASALGRLFRDDALRTSLGKRARARILAGYTHRDHALRLGELFVTLAEERARGQRQGGGPGLAGEREARTAPRDRRGAGA